MGCGASKSISTVGPQELESQRDAEDYSLEPVTLQITNIDEFDAVFTRLCALLNRLVELNNGVHCAVAEAKAAFAPVSGGFQLDVDFVPSADTVLLSMRTQRGQVPDVDGVQQLAQSASVKQADADVEEARRTLHAFLREQAAGQSVRIGRDGLLAWTPQASPADVPPPEQVKHFNECLSKLRSLLGNQTVVIITVVPAVAAGIPTVGVTIQKAAMQGVGFRTATKPASLLDIYSTQQGASIKAAEAFLADRAQKLAHRTKGLDMEWEVTTSYTVMHANEIENEDIQDQVDQLLKGVNLALFRLLNGCASSARAASLTNAVVEIVRPVLEAIKAKHANTHLSHRMRQMVSVRPEVEFQNEEEGVPPSFDFQVNIQLKPEAQVPTFPNCLPDLNLALLHAVEGVKQSIADALNELPAISVETDDLLERAKEFYELCPDAAAQMGFSMMDAVRCSKATGYNLKTLYETQDLFLGFGENIKRVADELADSSRAVAELLEATLPTRLEQVTEGDDEGAETPMSRGLSLVSAGQTPRDQWNNLSSGEHIPGAEFGIQPPSEQAIKNKDVPEAGGDAFDVGSGADQVYASA
mmetsp:Transcript_32463/g.96906  ORF Transcript_32463/g.96906 Transcript_32463/m.96906 type:complete len:585 (-) Transcript_32463:369-2123(-)